MQARVLGELLRKRGVIMEDDTHGGDGMMSNGGYDGMDVDDTNCARSNSNSGGSNNHYHHHPPQQQIDLVVCSPLTRCLQTSSHIFPSYFRESCAGTASNATHSSSSGQQPTTSTTIKAHDKRKEEDNNDALHDNVLDRNCRVCCHGDAREAYGMHYPDKRSPLTRLKSIFPTVTYHHLLTENDTDWQPSVRETHHDVLRRIQNLFHWLLHQNNHDNIAIVTHGVWMECALLHYCPEVLEFGKMRVYNCDVYCGTLVGLLDDNGIGSGVALRDVKKVQFYQA